MYFFGLIQYQDINTIKNYNAFEQSCYQVDLNKVIENVNFNIRIYFLEKEEFLLIAKQLFIVSFNT